MTKFGEGLVEYMRSMARGCDPDYYPFAEAADRIEELEAEIARHHRDFERWETLADKGAAKIELNRQLVVENEALKSRIEILERFVSERR